MPITIVGMAAGLLTALALGCVGELRPALARSLLPVAPVTHADPRITTSIDLRGSVPLVCRIGDLAAEQPAGEPARVIYSLQAVCNSPGGYRLVALHEADFGQRGRLKLDGDAVPVGDDGRTVLRTGERPARLAMVVEIASSGATAGYMPLEFAIEPR